MNVKTLISRLSIFFIGLPIVLAFVFANIFNHLPLHLLIIFFSTCASLEMYAILSKKTKLLNKVFIVACSILLPLSVALQTVLPSFAINIFPKDIDLPTYTLIAILLAVLAVEVFTAKTFESSLSRMGLSFFCIVYSGYLLTFVSKLTSYTKNGINVSTPVIAVFLLMVFLCDSFAWLFGVLFGKNNKGFIKASPNKSLAGFFGGLLGSLAAGIIAISFWADIFDGPIIKIIILSILTAFSSIIGDLAESIFKRSAEIKDSGKIIPGRGGALDSIDSILMAAPVFTLLINMLYGPFLG